MENIKKNALARSSDYKKNLAIEIIYYVFSNL